MRRRTFVLMPTMLLGVFLLSASGQGYDYGDPSELKGLTRLFIDTGSDLTMRKYFIQRFSKELPEIEVLETLRDQPELILIFTGSEGRRFKRGNGVLLRVAEVDGEQTLRLLASIDDLREGMFLKDPWSIFANQIIKEYRKHNPQSGSTNGH